MMHTISSNLSALMAYGKKMEVHANNIANMDSEGFKKSRAIITQGPEQNVLIEAEQIEALIQPVSGTDDAQAIQNNSNKVDLIEEIVGAEIARTGHAANLVPIKTADEMVGSLLDIIG